MEERFQNKLKATTNLKGQRKEHKLDLKAWYEVQASEAPKKCENCGKSLAATIAFHPRAHICHIIPKTKEGGCPSVATHPLNRWFGCSRCHDEYDKSVAENNEDKLQAMDVLPTLQHRAKQFIHLVIESERRRIPEFLL
jgi:hypothetical protein